MYKKSIISLFAVPASFTRRSLRILKMASKGKAEMSGQAISFKTKKLEDLSLTAWILILIIMMPAMKT